MSHSQPTLTNEQAGQLFQEIAGIAEAVDEHCYHLPADLDEPGVLHAFIDQMRRTVQRIGWIADKGAGGCGAMQMRGGAEEWMLSPALNDAMKRITTEEPS